MPNVNILITNTQTGWTRTLPTNDVGQYVVPDIQIGKYNIKAEAAGFKTAEQKNMVLQVGDRLRVDFQMKVGTTAETVTVEANAVRVQADSGEVSNVITERAESRNGGKRPRHLSVAALTPGGSSQIKCGMFGVRILQWAAMPASNSTACARTTTFICSTVVKTMTAAARAA